MIDKFMNEALKEALKALALKEVPVGCVIVHNGEIIGRGYNLREATQNGLAHAEIIALNEAYKKIGSWRLEDTEMYVTLEPCPMCTGALIQSRIKKVYFGAVDKRNGSIISNSILNGNYCHTLEYEYCEREECSKLLTYFFQSLRKGYETIELKELIEKITNSNERD